MIFQVLLHLGEDNGPGRVGLEPTCVQSEPDQAIVGPLIIWAGLGLCANKRTMGNPLLAGFKMEQICTKKTMYNNYRYV